MESIQLIGVDLDGTLLDPSGRITPASRRALVACRQAGIRVCLCTGRNLAEIRNMIPEDLEIDELCVLTHGASIVNRRTGAYFLHRRIDPAAAASLIRALVADCKSVPGRHMSVTGMHHTHMLRDCMRKSLRYESDAPASAIRVVHDTQEALIAACGDDIQLIDYSVPFSESDRIKALLLPIVDLDTTTGEPWRLELIPKGVNKGDGLSRLCGHYGIRREHVMAIGDGINDESMIVWAGLGVATGNAQDVLKAAADVVVESNAEDGFAKAIERFALKRAADGE
jgi:hypothetical protein